MKAKVKEKALEVLEKVEVEATGKVEVEALKVTKVVVSKVKKGKRKAQATTGVCHYCHKYETLKHSVDRSNLTWVTKLGMLT